MRIIGSFGERPVDGEGEPTSTLNRVWLPLLKKILAAINGHSVSVEFTQADLDGDDVLTFEHGLGSELISASLIDDAGMLRYDLLTVLVADENNVALDLTGATPIVGTWKLLIRRD